MSTSFDSPERAAAPAPASGGALAPPGAVTIVELDFEGKKERSLTLDEIRPAMERGRFVWLDIDAGEIPDARPILAGLGLADDEVVESALAEEPATRCARHEECLHLVLFGYRRRGEEFALERVSVILGEHLLVTIHRGPVQFLQAVRREYRSDFLRYAKSPSFLIYEIWDHLVENYLEMQKIMGDRVERLQDELQGPSVDDAVFARISQLGADLLHFRKVLLPVRAVLFDLSHRRSLFISETTQRFLGNMVDSVDHLLQDMLVDRDILSESLNLYMSMVSHRTNQVMKKLTVVSVIFLPLTFLVGVYGMNFEVFPELRWRFGYGYFWGVVAIIVGLILKIMRGARLL